MIYLNGVKLDFKTFPNGETLVDGEQIKSLVDVLGLNMLRFKYENDSDLIKLMFVKKHLDAIDDLFVDLDILYMPYSRMDRVEGDSVFTLKYVAEFINSLKFDRIYLCEPHSDVTPALLDKVIADYPTFLMVPDVAEKIGFDKEKDFLFFPDAGASKRYSKIGDYKTLVGHKERDFKTGKITKYEVIGADETLFGAKVIIVDDLCSYGGTFYRRDDDGNETGAAAELKKLGAAEIYLVVAHAENAIYEGTVLKNNSPINKVFTTNSIINISTTACDKLEVFDIISE